MIIAIISALISSLIANVLCIIQSEKLRDFKQKICSQDEKQRKFIGDIFIKHNKKIEKLEEHVCELRNSSFDVEFAELKQKGFTFIGTNKNGEYVFKKDEKR